MIRIRASNTTTRSNELYQNTLIAVVIMMSRIFVIIAGFISVATCFTTTTTSNDIVQKPRIQDRHVVSQRPPVLPFLVSTTLLFEGKESTTTSTDSSILDGVVELGESPSSISSSSTTDTKNSPGFMEQAVAPFLSQGEIDPQTLNPDLSDPKQARVIIYIILSLVPVLFLIPLMIGSRDLIPLDAVSPVQL